MLLPAPGRAQSALGMGTGGWRRGRGLAPLVAGPGDPGGANNTHYLFLGFVEGRQAFGDGAERACLPAAVALHTGRGRGQPPGGPLPGAQGIHRLSLGQRGGVGAPEEGSTSTPSLPPMPFQNLVQCFLVWGPGPRESALLAAAIVVLYPLLTLHHKGFFWSPVPKTMVPF